MMVRRSRSLVVVLALAFALAAAVPPAVLATAQPLRPMDLFDLETVGDPQISPDGRHVVYVRGFADVMTDKRFSNLWIVDADGSNHRPLTTGKQGDGSPRWSPDGTQLLFVSDREDDRPQLFRRFMDSGETARLTNLTKPPSGIAWSPDGRWISFAMMVPAKPRSIAEMPAPPEGAKWKEPPRVVDRSIYRYNGIGYLEPGFSHLFVIPAEGGTPRQVTSGDYHAGPPGLTLEEAVWSADSASLIVGAVRRPGWEDEVLDTELWDFPIDGGTPRALTDRRGPDGSPAVSPDGKRIAYLGFDDKLQSYHVRRLYVMDRDGANSRVLTADFDRDVGPPRWSADSASIWFVSEDRGNTGLWRTELRGKPERVARDIGSTEMAYGGGETFTLSRDGVYATTSTRPDLPGDVAVGRAGAGQPKLLTAVNADLLGNRTLGRVEEIVYQSSKDGREIQGWIIQPPDFDPSKRYPLILEIHGGPFANYGDRFDLEKQLMAASGYVVLYTNPRGSTSYGQEFGNLIHHAYPGDDFYDLDSGVDAMVAKGYVDSDQIFVTGGSGGGVLTCWMIGRSTRYRAAVTIYPVINWYSLILTSDIGGYASKYWFPGFPWDHVEHYEKRSLLSVVKNVKTPTMVLTGEADWRTPMSESEQYYKALKLLGVETVLVRVPDEPHGIMAHPSHHLAKILNIIAWFDQHRAGAAPPSTTATGSAAGAAGAR